MGIFSGRKLRWNHFGKKYTLRISDYEYEYADLYDALMKKVYEVRPDFEGQLAYIDQYGRQSIITNDKELRVALDWMKRNPKVHTTLSDMAVIAAADLAGRPPRSQSVPPERTSPVAQSRSPSSLESVPPRRAMSPPPVVQTPASTVRHHSPKNQVVLHQVPPPGYSYKYTTYGPYTQPILYGLPPSNMLLYRFLASPFPFGYSRSWIGPNKYHNWSGWGGGYHMGTGWGPVW